MAQLSSYPNVFNTCLVLLRRDGYSVTYDKAADLWMTERNGFSFRADNPIELLGLVAIYEKVEPKERKEYWWKIDDPNIIDDLDPE